MERGVVLLGLCPPIEEAEPVLAPLRKYSSEGERKTLLVGKVLNQPLHLFELLVHPAPLCKKTLLKLQLSITVQSPFRTNKNRTPCFLCCERLGPNGLRNSLSVYYLDRAKLNPKRGDIRR
jgi:hypothetical protein